MNCTKALAAQQATQAHIRATSTSHLLGSIPAQPLAQRSQAQHTVSPTSRLAARRGDSPSQHGITKEIALLLSPDPTLRLQLACALHAALPTLQFRPQFRANTHLQRLCKCRLARTERYRHPIRARVSAVINTDVIDAPLDCPGADCCCGSANMA